MVVPRRGFSPTEVTRRISRANCFNNKKLEHPVEQLLVRKHDREDFVKPSIDVKSVAPDSSRVFLSMGLVPLLLVCNIQVICKSTD